MFYSWYEMHYSKLSVGILRQVLFGVKIAKNAQFNRLIQIQCVELFNYQNCNEAGISTLYPLKKKQTNKQTKNRNKTATLCKYYTLWLCYLNLELYILGKAFPLPYLESDRKFIQCVQQNKLLGSVSIKCPQK